jgi:hypothetical protein
LIYRPTLRHIDKDQLRLTHSYVIVELTLGVTKTFCA